MYVNSLYKYLHDLRRTVENAAWKSKSKSELGRVSNSAQTCHNTSIIIIITIECTPHHAPLDLQMGSWVGNKRERKMGG
jgi:hypothetical protein